MRLGVSLMAALLVVGCGRVPPRPKNVPAESMFVGKRKDGVFVTVLGKEGIGWHLRIYGRDGALRKEGVYVLRGMARADLLEEDMVSFDGEAFHLSDGGLLVPRP